MKKLLYYSCLIILIGCTTKNNTNVEKNTLGSRYIELKSMIENKKYCSEDQNIRKEINKSSKKLDSLLKTVTNAPDSVINYKFFMRKITFAESDLNHYYDCSKVLTQIITEIDSLITKFEADAINSNSNVTNSKNLFLELQNNYKKEKNSIDSLYKKTQELRKELENEKSINKTYISLSKKLQNLYGDYQVRGNKTIFTDGILEADIDY